MLFNHTSPVMKVKSCVKILCESAFQQDIIFLPQQIDLFRAGKMDKTKYPRY